MYLRPTSNEINKLPYDFNALALQDAWTRPTSALASQPDDAPRQPQEQSRTETQVREAYTGRSSKPAINSRGSFTESFNTKRLKISASFYAKSQHPALLSTPETPPSSFNHPQRPFKRKQKANVMLSRRGGKVGSCEETVPRSA